MRLTLATFALVACALQVVDGAPLVPTKRDQLGPDIPGFTLPQPASPPSFSFSSLFPFLNKTPVGLGRRLFLRPPTAGTKRFEELGPDIPGFSLPDAPTPALSIPILNKLPILEDKREEKRQGQLGPDFGPLDLILLPELGITPFTTAPAPTAAVAPIEF